MNLDYDNIISITDDDIDDDELDLVKLVSTNASETNQYLIFLGSDNQYYATNVAKIEEILVYKDLDIVYNHDPDSYILGTANIRGIMTSIINFDKWMGNEVLDESEYELAIIAVYGGRRFALVVKEVEYITTIESKDMSDNSENNSKSSFIAQVSIGSVKKLCTIFDSDMMILDIFDSAINENEAIINSLDNRRKIDKYIMFADDSKFIRDLVEKLFIKIGCPYHLFRDGKELVDALRVIDADEIGLIITDLEMPNLDGRGVIEYVRMESKFNDVNIIIHTNMANDVLKTDLMKNQIAEVVNKVDMHSLSKAIYSFSR